MGGIDCIVHFPTFAFVMSKCIFKPKNEAAFFINASLDGKWFCKPTLRRSRTIFMNDYIKRTILFNAIYYIGSFVFIFGYNFNHKLSGLLNCVAFIFLVWGFKIFKHCPLKVIGRNFRIWNRVYKKKSKYAILYYSFWSSIQLLSLFF